MDKRRLLPSLLLLALALSSCATPGIKPEPAPPAVVKLAKAKLPDPPPEVMVPRAPSFQERLVNFFSSSPAKPTK